MPKNICTVSPEHPTGALEIQHMALTELAIGALVIQPTAPMEVHHEG